MNEGLEPRTTPSANDAAPEVLAAILEELRLIRQAQGIDSRSMSREEAARYLGIHKDTLYRIAREGQISFFQTKEGGAMTFLKDDLDAYRAKYRVDADE